MEEAEVARHDELVDEIDPDPGLGGEVRVHGYQMGFVLRISGLEELEDDVRVVKGPPLMGESGDQSFGIESCTSVVGKAKGTETYGSGLGKRGRQV